MCLASAVAMYFSGNSVARYRGIGCHLSLGFSLRQGYQQVGFLIPAHHRKVAIGKAATLEMADKIAGRLWMVRSPLQMLQPQGDLPGTFSASDEMNTHLSERKDVRSVGKLVSRFQCELRNVFAYHSFLQMPSRRSSVCKHMAFCYRASH